MKPKNYITEEDLLKFGVDTINLYVKLSNKESVQDIDDYDFISYKNGNSKAKELHRTITLKPSRLKKNKSYLMNTLSEEEFNNIQINSLSNLIKLIDILGKDPKIEEIVKVNRIDFAFDFSKKYEDLINMHKILILSHNCEEISPEKKILDYKGIIRTEGLLASEKDNKRSILKKDGILEICAYNKEKQLQNPYNEIETRLEYRFKQHNLSDKKSHKEVIEHQLKQLKTKLLTDRKNFETVEEKLSKIINKNYDSSNFKSGRNELSNFLIAFNQDILTYGVMKKLYNHSSLNGDINNYLDKFKSNKFKENPLIFVSKTQLVKYTVLLRKAIKKYIQGYPIR